MPMHGEQVLAVDHVDERRSELVDLLQSAGVKTREAQDCEGALAQLAERAAPLVFCEAELPGKSGFYLLRQVKERHPQTEVILLTQNATSYNLLQALRHGAFDVILRPLDSGEILFSTLERAARHLALRRQNEDLVEQLEVKARALERALGMMRALNASVERLTALSSIEELLAGLLDSALSVLGAKCGFIALIDRQSGSTGVKVCQGYPHDLCQRYSCRIPSGLVTEMARGGKSLLIADALPPELTELFGEAEREGLLTEQGILAVPLLLREREAGLVVLCGHADGHPFAEDDREVLRQLSCHTALVLEHVGTIHRLRQRVGEA